MMPFVMHRSFADNMGFNWPKEIAYKTNQGIVTWADLKADRITKQRKRLAQVEAIGGPVRRAAFLWVFYQPGLFGFAYQGWWLYIKTIKSSWAFSFRAFEGGLTTTDIMRQFPCGVIPVRENFELWKRAFAKRYWRPGGFERQGLLPGWVECEHEHGWPQKFEAAQ